MHTSPDPSLAANVSGLLILPSNHVMCEVPGGCGVFAYKRLPLVSLRAVYFSRPQVITSPAVSGQAQSAALGVGESARRCSCLSDPKSQS